MYGLGINDRNYSSVGSIGEQHILLFSIPTLTAKLHFGFCSEVRLESSRFHSNMILATFAILVLTPRPQVKRRNLQPQELTSGHRSTQVRCFSPEPSPNPEPFDPQIQESSPSSGRFKVACHHPAGTKTSCHGLGSLGF